MSWFGREVAPGKRPLKVNVFAHMMAHQGMLEQLPLFPYVGPGDIVPTAALSLTLPDTPRVHFYHYNDIPEVILCMASEGGLIATGQLYLQQGTHGVTTFIRQPAGPEGKRILPRFGYARLHVGRLIGLVDHLEIRGFFVWYARATKPSAMQTVNFAQTIRIAVKR